MTSEKAVASFESELKLMMFGKVMEGAETLRDLRTLAAAIVGLHQSHLEAALSLHDGGWQPIETAPMDGTVVLICGHDKDGAYYVADAKWDGAWCLFVPDSDDHTCPSWGHTHWQPLPAPPVHIAEDHGAKP